MIGDVYHAFSESNNMLNSFEVRVVDVNHCEMYHNQTGFTFQLELSRLKDLINSNVFVLHELEF